MHFDYYYCLGHIIGQVRMLQVIVKHWTSFFWVVEPVARHSFTSEIDATNGQAWGICFCKGFLTKYLKCIAPGGDNAKYSCRLLAQSAGSVARHFQKCRTLKKKKKATYTFICTWNPFCGLSGRKLLSRSHIIGIYLLELCYSKIALKLTLDQT